MALIGLLLGGTSLAGGKDTHTNILRPKVLIITMFGGEAQPWLEKERFTHQIKVSGLSEIYPDIHCTILSLCLVTTDRGYANAASSVTALMFNQDFDFRNTYILIAGIAGMDPADGTVGSAHWSRYVIDGGLQQEIDARQIPPNWSTGLIGIGADEPGKPPKDSYGTEVYKLDEGLLKRLYKVTASVNLMDSAAAQQYRLGYNEPLARGRPGISICDTVSSDIWWYGSLFNKSMNNWVKVKTEGRGNYCTTQQEDNATLTALHRAAKAGRLNFSRIAVLRTASDFAQEPLHKTPAESLRMQSGGYPLAVANAYTVASKAAHTIIIDWRQWKVSVPK